MAAPSPRSGSAPRSSPRWCSGRRSPPGERWAVRLGALISLVGLALGGLMTSTPAQTVPRSIGGVQRMIGAHSVGVPGRAGPAWR